MYVLTQLLSWLYSYTASVAGGVDVNGYRVEKPELLLDVDVNGSRKTGILCLRYIVKPLVELVKRQYRRRESSKYGSCVSGGILSRRVAA